MVFFIYQLGSLASVWAINNLIKKRCSSKDQKQDYRSVTSNKLDWCFGVFFHFEKQD